MADNVKQDDIYNPTADNMRSLDHSFTTVSLNSTPRRQSLDRTDTLEECYGDLYQFSSKEYESTQYRSDNIHKDSEKERNGVSVKKKLICCFRGFTVFPRNKN